MKISIITVTFNSSSFINECLKSVKEQKYNNIEHIIIDGASTDKTLSILESKRKQLAAFVSEPDKGVYHAMNKGIKIATGDIIGFLNSDDFYANEEVISRVVKFFKSDHSLDACYSDLIYTDKINTSKIIRYWKSNEFMPGSFSKGWCPPHPTFFCRRSVYEKFGNFNLDYQIASDVELMMRFLEVNKINILHIPEIWVKMRMGGISNKSFKNIIKLNLEVFKALYSHNLPINPFSFIFYKVISRVKQYL